MSEEYDARTPLLNALRTRRTVVIENTVEGHACGCTGRVVSVLPFHVVLQHESARTGVIRLDSITSVAEVQGAQP